MPAQYVANIDGDILPFAQAAYQKFNLTNQDLNCFSVVAEKLYSGVRISFNPKADLVVSGTSGDASITLGGRNRCGRGITYEFAADGKFVSEIADR